MKKKIQKTILSLGIVGLVCLLPNVAMAGWVQQVDFCQVFNPFGIPTFDWVSVCDAWGGGCSDQYCCEIYIDPPIQ